MRSPSEIPAVTQTIELGFLGYVATLVEQAGWEVVRRAHPVRSGCSLTLRNRVGVEFILEAEATWEPRS